MMSKIFLHFHGVRGATSVGLQYFFHVSKVAILVILAISLLTFFLEGLNGVKEYYLSRDYKYLFSFIVSSTVALCILILISFGGLNFFRSWNYCKKNKIKISEFYSKSPVEIIEIWKSHR